MTQRPEVSKCCWTNLSGGHAWHRVTTNLLFVNISCHSLLAYRVSAEKAADNLMEIPLYVFWFFFAFSLFLIFCYFDYYVFQWITLWVYPAWDSLSFLDFADCLFPCVKSFWLSSLQIFPQALSLSLLLEFRKLSIDAFNAVQEVSETAVISFHSVLLILFCGSDFHQSSRSVIGSSVSLILLLIPSSVLFPWRRKWQPTPVFLPRESHVL